jgi:hypothetical protein
MHLFVGPLRDFAQLRLLVSLSCDRRVGGCMLTCLRALRCMMWLYVSTAPTMVCSVWMHEVVDGTRVLNA